MLGNDEVTLESLTGKVKAVGETLQKSIADARAEFKTGVENLGAEAKEKWDKFSQDIASAAKEASDVSQALKEESEHRRNLEEKVQELGQRGVSVAGSDDAEMLEQRIALTQLRNSITGKPKLLFGDEPESELASAEDVKLADAAFQRFMRGDGGAFEAMRGNMPEQTFAVGSGLYNPSYGIAVPPYLTGRIIGNLYTYGSLRGLALVRSGINSDSAKLLRFSGKLTVNIAGESVDWSPGNLPKGASIEYPLLDWDVTSSVHRNILMDSSFNLARFLRSEATMALGETEGDKHINGTGVQEPTGILTLPKDDVAISGNLGDSAFGTLKAIETGVAGGVGHGTAANEAFGFNPAIAAINALHSRFRTNATWCMARSSYAAFAMVRDADGNYLMPMAGQVVREGGVLSLVQRPVFINDHVPALANNAYFAIVGDFMQGFEIADHAMGMFALPDPYSDKPNVEMTLARRSGARVADSRAFRLLKASA